MEYSIYILLETTFTQYSSHLGYIGIFLFFVTVDQLTPLPEEVTLLTIGYLASHHILNPVIAGAVSLTAFISVDTGYFFLSRSGNKFIGKIIERKSSLITRYKEKMKNKLGLTLIVLCFIPRMRLFSPIFAGITNIPFRKFLLFDTAGLLIFTSLYLSLGMVFHNSINLYLTKVERMQHIIFTITMVVIAILVVLFIRKNQQK